MFIWAPLYLRHPPVRHGVGGNDVLGGPVPFAPKRPRTAITAILSLPQVALTCGVRRPGAIRRADGVYVRARVAVKSVSPFD